MARSQAPKKSTNKTTREKASSKKISAKKSSERSSRARAKKPPKTTGPADGKQSLPRVEPPSTADDHASKNLDLSLSPIDLKLGNYRGPGRPKDTPDVWTPAHKAEVAEWLFEYTDSVDLPSVAEFCRLYGIRFQRLGEFEELVEGREYLQAKRASAIEKAAVSTVRETGCRVAFFARMAANTGVFSLVDKVETENKNTNVTTYAIPENGREGKG